MNPEWQRFQALLQPYRAEFFYLQTDWQAYPAGTSPEAALPVWLASLGWPEYPKLLPLPLHQGAPLLTGWLATALAYPVARMPTAVATECASAWIASLGSNPSLVTNHNWEKGSWQPLTAYTFDALLVGWGSAGLAYLLLADED